MKRNKTIQGTLFCDFIEFSTYFGLDLHQNTLQNLFENKNIYCREFGKYFDKISLVF